MGFTVRDLLNSQSLVSTLSEMKLLAGEQGFSNEIKGVTIIEAPDIVKFIEGGEVLLTGLYAFKSCTVEEFGNYISDLHEKEVSAIFLKQGRDVEQANEKIELLRAYCRQYHIPLIDVPFQVSFQVIMSIVMERLFNEEVTRLKYYKMTHDNFCALSLDSKQTENTISRILDMLSKLIRNPAAIFDQKYHCLYCSNPSYSKMVKSETRHMIDPSIISRNIYYKQTGNPDCYIAEIILATGQTVFLQVWQVQSDFTSMDLIAIENAIVALQYEFSKQYTITELEQKFHNDLIQNVLLGKLTTREEIERNRVFTGLSLDGSYRVFVIGFRGGKNEDDFNERARRIDLLKECVVRQMKGCLVHYSLDQLAVIHQVEREQSLKSYRTFFQTFFSNVRKEFAGKSPDTPLIAGIGRTVHGITDIHLSYHEASDALSYFELNGMSELVGDEHSLFFSDLGVFKLLCQIEDWRDLVEFIPENLMRLYQSDNKQRDELIQTLECYLRHQLNFSETAKELFIHYKTAMYRINRISEITGIDFDNSTEVLSVRIGMIVFQMIEKRKNREV